MKISALIALMLGLVAVGAACSRDSDSPSGRQPPIVLVAVAQRGPITRSISLPGDLTGYYQSTLYAKVTGYLKTISVDKGDWVKAGQVLAEIEVPELKERLERARADLVVEKITYDRLQQVWKSDPRLVARQDVDVAFGKYQEAKAQADELGALLDYTKIVAPFDGVITGRFVDPGALIRASGGAGGGGQGFDAAGGGQPNAILSEAMIDWIRIYLYVPEEVVGLIRRGMPASFTLQDYPGRVFTGTVARFSTSLDLSTRTMLTEVDIDNPHHELYPRDVREGNLATRASSERNSSSQFRSRYNRRRQLCLRRSRWVVSKVPVTTGIRTTDSVEITAGLEGEEQVVATIGPGLSEGETVKVVAPSSPSGQGRFAQNLRSQN